jgi:chromate reductase, NAD(P)H dehydrogenase (quinone)
MKISIIAGSLRKDSINMKLANQMTERYKNRVEIGIIPINDIPLFNQDLELEPPEGVTKFKDKILESDGIIFITPEYNHSIPGVLKNAIDWASRVEKVLAKKPVMVAGVTPGVVGTVRAQEHLRVVLDATGAIVLPANEIFIGSVLNKINDAGEIIDQLTLEFIDHVMNNFLAWIKAVRLY